MEKRRSLLSIILVFSLLFTGCSMLEEDKTIYSSGDLGYYAKMGAESIETDYKGKYIEVTGDVGTLFENIGELYLGNSLTDDIQFSCKFSSKSDIELINKGDYITVCGKIKNRLVNTIYLENCTIKENAAEKQIATSGNLSHYAEMGLDILKKDYKGKYIEVTGEIDTLYQNLGKFNIGNSFTDNIEFSCNLIDEASIESVNSGDCITVCGKLTNCLSSTIYLENCTIKKETDTATSETTSNTTSTPDSGSTVTTEDVHVHSFSNATCNSPKTCSCGATEGTPTDHNWQDASCSTPQTCSNCGATNGAATGHNFSNGKCTQCGQKDPNFVQEEMVWIPTKGGSKYHSRSGCSNMEDPELVTKSEAIARGFTACKRCH